MISEIIYKDMPENRHNKAFKHVPALRASTGPKKAAPLWAALLKRYVYRKDSINENYH